MVNCIFVTSKDILILIELFDLGIYVKQIVKIHLAAILDKSNP